MLAGIRVALLCVTVLAQPLFRGKKAASRRDMNRAWSAAANELGLDFQPADRWYPSAVLEGKIDGVKLRVATTTIGYGDTKLYWTTYTLSIPRTGPRGLLRPRVRHGDWFVRNVLGAEDVGSGDPGFDRLVVIDSPHGEQWREYLTPERATAIKNIFERWNRARIENGEITVSSPGRCSNVVALVDGINAIVREVRVLGRFPDEAEDEWSLDDVVGEWAGVPGAPATADRGSVGVAFDETFAVEHLFGSGIGREAAEQRFESHWRRRSVAWSGVVVSATPYGNDVDFGVGPGVRAVVTIGYVDGMRLISNRVDAIVGVAGSPSVRAGQQLSFSGEVTRMDHPARNIYVAGADLSEGL